MNARTAGTESPPNKFSVGLTGGIGSGKSTVADLFRACGATVIDSDQISHQLTQPAGTAIPAIRASFGADYINDRGALDRERMRQRVFSDSAAKQQLEAILHPLIRAEMLAQAAAHAAPYLLLVVPLLLETANYRGLVQRVLVVDCAEKRQIEHTMQRSKLNAQEVHAIMAHQLSRTERLCHADDVIHNDGSIDDLRAPVKQLHRRYLSLASGNI
ncbi:MAG: dephospho-CoA kinase [Sideroxydans sp.]|nr:dephospho-CoA kinase [Sideroxydans sp.]